MKTLFLISDISDLKWLSQFNNQGKIIALQQDIASSLKELNLEYLTVLDYTQLETGHELRKEATTFFRNWYNSHKNFNITYKGLSLFEIALSGFVVHSPYFHGLSEIIQKIKILKSIFNKELPDKIIYVDNNTLFSKLVPLIAKNCILQKIKARKLNLKSIIPSLTKYIITFQTKKRSITKIKNPTKNKILIFACGPNYITPILPVIKKIKNKVLAIRVKNIRNDTSLLDKEDISYKDFEKYFTNEVKYKTKLAFNMISEKWNEFKKNKSFKMSLVYKDVPIFDLMPFEYFFSTRKRIFEVCYYINIINQILEYEDPRLVWVVEETNPISKIAVMLANQKGIPTLLSQHGMLGRFCLYDLPIQSNKMAIWGQSIKKHLIRNGEKSSKLIVTGMLSLNNIPKFDRLKTCKKLNLDPNKKIVVLATNKVIMNENEILIKEVLKASKQIPSLQVVIKLHPMEDGLSPKRLAKETGTNPLIIKDINLQELLNASDLVITYYSTVGLEAMILNKPVIIINLTGMKDEIDYVKDKAALGVYKPEDILPTIKKVLENKKKIKDLLSKAQKFVINNAYKRDGKNISRMIKLLDSMAKLIKTNNLFRQVYNLEQYNHPYNFSLAKAPFILDLEATNQCNMDCIMCDRQLMSRPIGFMDYELYKNIIDQAAAMGVKGVRFIRAGEPFLHSNIFKMVQYAKNKKLLTHITTNGLLLTQSKIDEILGTGLDSIIFSFQGTTKKEYEKMRNNRFYEKVKSNIQQLVKTRNERGLIKPHIQITTTILDETPEQISKFKEDWSNVVDKVDYWYTNLTRLTSIKRVKPLLKRQKIYLPLNGRCNEVRIKLSIDWDGKVTACCGDFNSELCIGDLNSQTLLEIWNSEKINRIRQILEKGERYKLPFCSKCTAKF